MEALSIVGNIASLVSIADKCIRLLRLNPAKLDSDRLMCSLDTVRLEQAPPFCALSYCWGEEPRDHVVHLNDRIVKVTRNLFDSLRECRRSCRELLWVDQLCIDDSNLEERSHQVALLSDIFRTADRVLVYLPGLIDQREDINRLKRFISPREGRSSISRAISLLAEEQAARRNRRLLSDPWFTRIWSVQETVLSKDIVFLINSEEVSWSDFWAGVFKTYQQPGHLPVDALRSTAHAFRLYLIVTSSRHFSQVVNSEPAFQLLRSVLKHQSALDCKDPRDKVFALYGLLGWFDITVPRPDYSKSVNLVFQEAAMSVDTMLMAHAGDRCLHRDGVHTVSPRRRFADDNDKYHRKLIDIFAQALAVNCSARCPGMIANDRYKAAEDICFVTDNDLGTTDTLDDNGSDSFSDSGESDYCIVFDQLVGGLRKVLSTEVAAYLRLPASYAGGTTCKGGNNTPNEATDSRKASAAVGNRRDGTAGTKSKDKAEMTRKRPAEEEDEEGEDLDRRPLKQPKDQVDIWDRLACPYFQRNSQGPRILGSCRGLGFENLSRLKEHLYRDHLIHPCARCGMVFRKQDDLVKHQLRPESCPVIDWRLTFDRAEGFDNQQERDIRRKTIRSWQAVFKILFPEDAEHTYPPQHHRNPQFIQLFDQFQAHYHEQIHRLIPERLSDASFLAMFSLEEQQGIQIAITNIASDIHREVVGSFRSNVLRASQVAELPDPDRLFLDYLGLVAPEGAFPDNFLATQVGPDELTGFSTGAQLPLGRSSPEANTDEAWFLVG